MSAVPKLWDDSIATHRHAVRTATLDATAALVAERGLTGVTMSEVAKRAGVGRATLYKYFPDVESILRAWHERQIDEHLTRLLQIRDQTVGAAERVRAVLTGYATAISHQRAHDDHIVGMLHSGEYVAAAHQRLREFIRELIADAAASGAIRRDVPVDELTVYCIHAVAGATALHGEAAIHRLVQTILTGLLTSDHHG